MLQKRLPLVAAMLAVFILFFAGEQVNAADEKRMNEHVVQVGGFDKEWANIQVVLFAGVEAILCTATEHPNCEVFPQVDLCRN